MIFNASWLSVSTMISIAIPNITSWLGLAGGLIGVTMFYLLPVMIQLKLSKQPWHSSSNLVAIIFFGVLVLMGYGSVIVTLIKTVKGIEKMPRWLPESSDVLRK